MLKTILRIIFKNIFLHLHQNNCQNIWTPPIPSYRAPPTFLEGDPYPHVRACMPNSVTAGNQLDSQVELLPVTVAK